MVFAITRLRTELIRRELANTAELQIDEAGEAAMAAKAATVAAESEKRAVCKQAATVNVLLVMRCPSILAIRVCMYGRGSKLLRYPRAR